MINNNLIIFMPSIESGGVEKNLFLIANDLIKQYRYLTIITASQNTGKFDKKIKIIKPKTSGYVLKFRYMKIILSIIFLIKELLRNKKMVVLSFQANIYAIIVCRLFNKKIVARANSSPTGWIGSNFKSLLFKLIFPLAKTIIVNSNEFKKELLDKLKVFSICILNPLDKKIIIQKSNEIIKNPYKRKKTLKFISIGRLVDQKDHLTLLKAFNHIKNKINFELLIIGQGSNKHLIQNYINSNKLNKDVRLIGFKDNPYPYLKISDALILSSLYEGLPNVILESIVLKKLVISSNCPTGPKEILRNGKCGLLFKTGSFKDLSKKILFFSKNRKKCLEKINSSQLTLNIYNKKLNIKKYSDVIKAAF